MVEHFDHDMFLGWQFKPEDEFPHQSFICVDSMLMEPLNLILREVLAPHKCF